MTGNGLYLFMVMTGGWFIIVLPTLHGYINGGGFAYFPCLICLRVHMIKGCPTWFFMIFSRCFFFMKQSRDVHGTSNPIYKHGTSWDFKYIMSKKLPFGVLLMREGIHAGYRSKRRFSQHRPATSVSGVVDNFVLTISNQLIWLLQKRGQNDTLWWWLTVRHG